MVSKDAMLRWCVWVDNIGHYFDDINEAHEFAQTWLNTEIESIVIEAIKDSRTIN
jgi:hypothetical protein